MRTVIVEDNRDGAESLAAVLEDLGHEVTILDDGSRAADACPALEPHVVFIDLMLPGGMDGLEVARRLREAGAQAKLVAVTGLVAREVREKTIAAGFSHFLLKPYSISALEQVLDAVAAEIS
jgi:CheY-like chemotaxis protein